MRRYQLSGLEHIHMMKRVPRSYDMTRTHIMHRGVNKHVDVVLRCSPKYFKKKKVAVSVVRSDKKTAAARIRANAMRGYVAVRKTVNEQFERDRKAAAEAFEFRYGGRNPGADSLIHDMRSQLAAMAKKSSEYIENQLSHPADGFSAISDLPEGENQPILSHESEEILRRGGYRIPNRQPPEDPYSVEYMTQASDEEFHDLMDSLERSLDEVCRKYSVPPVEEEEPEQPKTPVMPTYSGYSFPNRRSLSVTNKQEITDEPPAEEETVYQYPDNDGTFKPAISFVEGGGHYIPEDELFDRKLGRAGDSNNPPAYLSDDDADSDESGEYAGIPQTVFAEADETPQPLDVPVTDSEDSGLQADDYPNEDYTQQRVFFPSEPQESSAGQYPPEEDDFAEPTMFSDSNEQHDETVPGFYAESDDIFGGNDNDYSVPSPDPADEENSGSDGDETAAMSESAGNSGSEEGEAAVMPESAGDSEGQQDHGAAADEDAPPPFIFPDDDEDLPPPFIFPDEEEEPYTPAPVSPDSNVSPDDGAVGVIDRSGHTMFSRSGDQIKKVIGVIRGPGDTGMDDKAPVNSNVEITYSDNHN
jgi:hypothetical protein